MQLLLISAAMPNALIATISKTDIRLLMPVELLITGFGESVAMVLLPSTSTMAILLQ